jgi:hypothetical protein
VCVFTPDDNRCLMGRGSTCDPELGCVECFENAECDDKNNCTTDTCGNDHLCKHSGCPSGQVCCLLGGCIPQGNLCLLPG